MRRPQLRHVPPTRLLTCCEATAELRAWENLVTAFSACSMHNNSIENARLKSERSSSEEPRRPQWRAMAVHCCRLQFLQPQRTALCTPACISPRYRKLKFQATATKEALFSTVDTFPVFQALASPLCGSQEPYERVYDRRSNAATAALGCGRSKTAACTVTPFPPAVASPAACR